MKLFKDLRGVSDSCTDTRSYGILFETLCELSGETKHRSEQLFAVMQKTVSSFHGNEEVCKAMLRCLVSFVYSSVYRLHASSNDDLRVDSGSTSTNGITLFKKTAVIICEYIQFLMASYQDFVLRRVEALRIVAGSGRRVHMRSPGAAGAE